jgi:hypothetical protein
VNYSMIVHSDKRRKPRYYVTEREEVLFETDDGAEAVQWTIDQMVPVEIADTIELESCSKIHGINSQIGIKDSS